MGVGSLLSLLRLLLKVATALAEWLERRSLIREGERRALLAQHEQLARILKASQEEREKVAAMSDDDLDEEWEHWVDR